MLKTLLKKQLLELTAFLYQSGKKGKRRSAAALIGYSVLLIYAFGVICWLFSLMAGTLCAPLVQAGLDWMYFALVAMMATAFGVIGSVFTTYSGLYAAKDNELLLSMPVPPSMILLSRMAGIYIMSFLFEALVLIPSVIVYCRNVSIGAAGLVCLLLILFLLPLLALTISCVLGWLVGLLASRVRSKSIITSLLSLAFFAVYYYLYFQMNKILQAILANAEYLSGRIKTIMYPFYQLGLAAQGNWLSMLIFAAIILALFAVVYYILSRSFLKVTTTQRGAAKTEYREKPMKVSSQNAALLKKEALRCWNCSAYMLNCCLGALLLIAAAVFVVIKGTWLLNMAAGIGLEPLLPLFACAAVCIIVSMNLVTAPSISLEGNTLWIVRSLPVSAWRVLCSKLNLHMLITAIPAVICSLAAALTLGFEAYYIAAIPVFAVIFTAFCGELGLVFNLKIPNLTWSSEAVAVKQSMSVLLTMLVDWVVIVALGIGYYLLYSALSAQAFVALAAAVLLAADLLMMLWLKKRGSRAFAEL